MAFPTSGLSNNQVHKEGNRSFVYDSALGVWDQVRETDNKIHDPSVAHSENKITQGVLSNTGLVFPAGHIIQTVATRTTPGNASITGHSHTKFGAGCKATITNVRANSYVLVNFQFHLYVGRSSGTTTESNCGVGIQRLEGTYNATNYDLQLAGARDWMYHFQAGGSGATSAVFGTWCNMTGIDTAPNTGTNTYYITADTADNGNQFANIYAEGTDGSWFGTICQEIAQ